MTIEGVTLVAPSSCLLMAVVQLLKSTSTVTDAAFSHPLPFRYWWVAKA